MYYGFQAVLINAKVVKILKHGILIVEYHLMNQRKKNCFISKSIGNITKIDIDDFFNSILDEFQLKQKAFYNMCGLLKQT